MFTGAWRRRQKPRRRVEARAASFDHQILRPSKSVDGEAFRAARVPRRRSGFDEFEAARERLSEANCGAWLAFGWPDFWVFLAGCRGACLCGLFLQVKARFAQIC